MPKRKESSPNIVKNTETNLKGGFHVSSEGIVTSSGYSLGDYYPSGSRIPKGYGLKITDYKALLADEKTKKETKIPFDKDEIEKISKLNTRKDCVKYILGNKNSFARYETYIIICDSILKVLPTVIFASLPLLLLRDITGEINNFLIIFIYLIMFMTAIICGYSRFYARGKLFALEEYHNFANEMREKRS